MFSTVFQPRRLRSAFGDLSMACGGLDIPGLSYSKLYLIPCPGMLCLSRRNFAVFPDWFEVLLPLDNDFKPNQVMNLVADDSSPSFL